MSKFKPGDRVRCINAPHIGNELNVGMIYLVSKAYGGLVELSFMPYYTWMDERFELCTQAVQQNGKTTLPIDSNARKNIPMFRGCLRYFPAALAGVAHTSKLGNDKHNPNEEMHHARGKSTDQGDCIIRHLMDVEDLYAAYKRGDSTITPEAILTEVNQLAWRALAFSQEMHEVFGAPLAPGAKVVGGSTKNAKGD